MAPVNGVVVELVSVGKLCTTSLANGPGQEWSKPAGRFRAMDKLCGAAITILENIGPSNSSVPRVGWHLLLFFSKYINNMMCCKT